MLNELLALRAQIHQFLLEEWPGTAPSAETLNVRNQHMLDQAAKLLGKDKFIQIFGFSPDEKINLVDPSIQLPTK